MSSNNVVDWADERTDARPLPNCCGHAKIVQAVKGASRGASLVDISDGVMDGHFCPIRRSRDHVR